MRLIIDIENMGNGKMRLDFESETDSSRLVDPDATKIGEEVLAYVAEPRYLYGMRSRGFAPACQPMDGLVERRDSLDNRYYDLLVYNMPLSEKKIEEYELDYLGLDKEEKNK